MKLLIISGDRALAQGKQGPFYYMLEEFSKYWERIDIITPKTRSTKPCLPVGGSEIRNIFENVFIHSSNLPLILQPLFILKEGLKIFRQQKFDLFTVHSYPPFYNDIGGRWLYDKIKKPYILEVHHITGYPKSGNFKEWFYQILNKIFIKHSANKAKIVRVVNQGQTPGFLKKFGVNPEKIKYASAAYIDLETFKPLNLDKKYDLVFAGRLAKNKGIILLLEAIKKLKNIKLIIVGSGPMRTKIENYIKKNALQNNVEFSGWLQTINDVAKIYNQSKIMIMPSFNEGGPRVTLEAMACSVPIITSRVGIMLDIISHEQNGIFIDWDINDIIEKIKLLLNNEELRTRIAENGHKTVQQFERKKIIANYAKLCQTL